MRHRIAPLVLLSQLGRSHIENDALCWSQMPWTTSRLCRHLRVRSIRCKRCDRDACSAHANYSCVVINTRCVAAPTDEPMDLPQVAQGLRALVGEMGASEFQPRLEALVRQVERLAAEPASSPVQTASASSTARAERLAAKAPAAAAAAPAPSPAPAPAKPRKKASSPKKKTKSSQLA